MNISEIFIKRPIATSLLMAAIALFGIVAYRALAVSDLPTVDFPTLQIQAGLPGGDPGTMASAVASPIERQLTTISGVDSMTSSSGMGNSQVTLQFDLARSMDSAAVDVQTALSEVMPLLPAGMPNPPTFRKQNPADQDIMQLSLISSSLSLRALDDYAETLLRAAHLDGQRRLAGAGAGRAEVRRPRAGRSRQAARAADRDQRSRSGAAELERQPADRPAVRARTRRSTSKPAAS